MSVPYPMSQVISSGNVGQNVGAPMNNDGNPFGVEYLINQMKCIKIHDDDAEDDQTYLLQIKYKGSRKNGDIWLVKYSDYHSVVGDEGLLSALLAMRDFLFSEGISYSTLKS